MLEAQSLETHAAQRACFANTSFRKQVELEKELCAAEAHAANVAATANIIATECAKVDPFYETLFESELERLVSLYESSMLAASNDSIFAKYY